MKDTQQIFTQALREQEKHMPVFKAMCALKTEAPTQVGQAPRTPGIQTKEQPHPKKAEDNFLEHRTPTENHFFIFPSSPFIKRLPGKLAYVT